MEQDIQQLHKRARAVIGQIFDQCQESKQADYIGLDDKTTDVRAVGRLILLKEGSFNFFIGARDNGGNIFSIIEVNCLSNSFHAAGDNLTRASEFLDIAEEKLGIRPAQLQLKVA